ncbi:MAG: peptidase M22, partial [Clostridia bacterium]|nr:peptidase M22 [Clostridia bacterium]
ERGLRQSDAVFSHVRNLPGLMERAEAVLRDCTPMAIGVSVRPRDAEGSYMPCFLAGQAAASSMAAALHIPPYTFSHQNGHVMAAAYSSGSKELLSAPFGAFHVSGGTTEVLYVVPEERDFRIEMIGETADINAGQLIDRVGVHMGLAFPCGMEMERLAGTNDKKIPKPRIHVKDCVCNLSGAENLAVKLYNDTNDAALVSAYVLETVGETLSKMTDDLLTRYPDLPLLYAGGVMSNRILQKKLGARFHAYFSEPQFSADNAAGIALLTKQRHEQT